MSVGEHTVDLEICLVNVRKLKYFAIEHDVPLAGVAMVIEHSAANEGKTNTDSRYETALKDWEATSERRNWWNRDTSKIRKGKEDKTSNLQFQKLEKLA